MQRLTLTAISSIARLWREHQPQRVDDVAARLLSCAPLAEDASHLRNRGDDPAFLAGLINDRQIELLRHGHTIPPQRPAEEDGETGIRTRDTTIFSLEPVGPETGRLVTARFAGPSLEKAPRRYRWFPDSWGFGPGGGHLRPKTLIGPDRRMARGDSNSVLRCAT